jgi:tRNA wybutosine-synthesizing protein 1
MKLPNWDPPETIMEGMLQAQTKILTGYKAHPTVDMQKFREAHRPKHVAISLTGEPTLYAPIGEIIRTIPHKGLTAFLVTNGNLPQKLAALSAEPTQLYVSVCAPSKEVFNLVCRPQISQAWEKLNETLAYLPSFRCPTVIRSTLVRNLNMQDVEGYAALVGKAQPTYIEVKAYMHIGFSGLRLGFDRMPSHGEVYDFAVQLAELTGYKVLDESKDSRVVLLSRLDKAVCFSSS